MEELIKKAGILVEALPFIQKFYGKTLVVKYGGNAMINDTLKDSVMEDLTLLKYIGLHPIVVHGGGPDISSALKTYNIESEFINGLRVTDKETMKVAQMVLIGKTNKEIVAFLNIHGGNAVGISGIDSCLFECEKQSVTVDGEEKDIGYVGNIKKVNYKIVQNLCDNGYIPVIAPIGTDSEGNSYNINADTAAAELAGAMKAEKLMLLTDIEGIKYNVDDKEVIETLDKTKTMDLIEKGIITGGMIPKVLGCLKAIENGVGAVHIADGRVPHCLCLLYTSPSPRDRG